MKLYLEYTFGEGGKGHATFLLPDTHLEDSVYKSRMEEFLYILLEFVNSVEKDKGTITCRRLLQ